MVSRLSADGQRLGQEFHRAYSLQGFHSGWQMRMGIGLLYMYLSRAQI